MAKTTRYSDPRGSLAIALLPHEPNQTHKLNVFIVQLSCTLFPRVPNGGREAGHVQTMYYYDSHLQSTNGIGINLLQSNESSPISQALISQVLISEVPISEVPVSEVLISEVLISEVLLSDVPISEVLLSEVLISDVQISEVLISEVLISEVLISEVLISEVLISEVPLYYS